MVRDFYATLGVAPDASSKAIAQAYRALARSLHPDLNPDDPDAADRFKAVTEAYDTLGDPQRRAAYDADRAEPPLSWPPGPGGSDPWSAPFGFDLSWLTPTPVVAVRLAFAEALAGATVEIPALTVPCRACAGRSRECTLCSGTGSVDTEARAVRIPPGVCDGDRFSVAGNGDEVVVAVAVAPDARFSRRGRHVATTVTVTPPEAALGATVPVTTPDGSVVKLRVPAGSQPGAVLRLAGLGGPGLDLYITLSVAIPTTLSVAERDAYTTVRDATATINGAASDIPRNNRTSPPRST